MAKMRTTKQPSLFVLTVTKPGSPNGTLRQYLLGYDAAWEADMALRRKGFDVSWERHGYTVCRDADDAVESASFWLNHL